MMYLEVLYMCSILINRLSDTAFYLSQWDFPSLSSMCHRGRTSGLLSLKDLGPYLGFVDYRLCDSDQITYTLSISFLTCKMGMIYTSELLCGQ